MAEAEAAGVAEPGGMAPETRPAAMATEGFRFPVPSSPALTTISSTGIPIGILRMHLKKIHLIRN